MKALASWGAVLLVLAMQADVAGAAGAAPSTSESDVIYPSGAVTGVHTRATASAPVARRPEETQQSNRHARSCQDRTVGCAHDARAQGFAVHQRRAKVETAWPPAQLGLFTGGRQVDALQAARDRVLERFRNRRGHYAVTRPERIETGIIQVDAVSDDECDPGGDDPPADPELKHPQRIARRQPLADVVEELA